MHQKNWHLLALFLFIVCSWGLAWPINKIGLGYLSPLWYTSIRLIIGTVSMLVIVLATKNLIIPRWQDMPLIFVIGILQICGFIFLANIGLSYLPAGRSSLLAYTTPLWVMPIAIIFCGERSSLFRWLGFGLGMGGLIILLSPWQMDWHDRNTIFGTGMLLLGSFIWGVSIICTRYMKWTKSPLQLIPWQLLVGTIPILFYSFWNEPNIQVIWHPNLILSLLYTGVLVTGLSYWSGVVINKAVPATVLSIGFLAVPVFSLTISALFMQESINMTTGVAISCILLGLVCVAV